MISLIHTEEDISHQSPKIPSSVARFGLACTFLLQFPETRTDRVETPTAKGEYGSRKALSAERFQLGQLSIVEMTDVFRLKYHSILCAVQTKVYKLS